MPSYPPIKAHSLLRNLALFSDLAEEEIERIVAGTSVMRAPKGETICHRGEPCVGFHVVVYGQVKLGFSTEDGAEKVIEILSPGQSFGEALMFLDKPYIVFAQALADCLLLHVSKRTVFEEIERDRHFARKLLGGLSRRLHALVLDVVEYSLRSGAQRVIGFLLRAEAERAEGDDVELSVRLPTNKTNIASRLNLSPEHFSRILHDLAEAGLIRVERRTVHICDPERLRRYEFTDGTREPRAARAARATTL